METTMKSAADVWKWIFPEKYKFKFTLGVWNFIHQDYIAINLLGLIIRLPIIIHQVPKDGMASHFGFIANSEAFQLGLWHKTIVMNYPWTFTRTQLSVLDYQGWTPYIEQKLPHYSKLLNHGVFKDGRMMHQAPYRYLLGSNKMQKTAAFFYCFETVLRMRILKRFKFGPTRKHHFIKVFFENEIGENVGKWKGGVKECEFEILPQDATPFHTIQRMQMTRKF